jgi:hypothetical protein
LAAIAVLKPQSSARLAERGIPNAASPPMPAGVFHQPDLDVCFQMDGRLACA